MTSIKKIRVDLILNHDLDITDYELLLGNKKIEICFNSAENDKYCDIVITDKEPLLLKKIPVQQKDCHGTTIIINKISNPLEEKQYEEVFSKINFLKHRKTDLISDKTIRDIINSEVIKSQVINNKLDIFFFFYNKYTRNELFNRFWEIGFLLIPFSLIIIYLLLMFIMNVFGYSFSFLHWFVDFRPNLRNNILEELTMLTLFYSFFNIKFYYDYTLSIFDNINNDVFQFNGKKRKLHKILHSITPVLLFVSTLILLKELFVFKFGYKIAEENSFINIGLIIDEKLPFIKAEFLIMYFLLIDVFLCLLTLNFKKTISQINIPFSSNRQIKIIDDAFKSFRISIIVDIAVIVLTYTILSMLLDNQSKLAIQLIIIQLIYLVINLITIINDLKYR